MGGEAVPGTTVNKYLDMMVVEEETLWRQVDSASPGSALAGRRCELRWDVCAREHWVRRRR
jgi:hypothetical protein